VISQEDIEKYLKKSGDLFIYEDNLIENDQGFMSWKIAEDKLVLLNVYGNGKYWDTFSIELAKKLGLKSILTATRRSPKAFTRKFGYKITGYILEKEV
jgi:hypothetical protein